MQEPVKQTKFTFDEFEVVPEKHLLTRNGQVVPLRSKALDLLVLLVERRGEMVTKAELLEKVWENQFVEENNLTVQISALRKALGEVKGENRFIVTVPGRGYRFVGVLNGHHTNGAASQLPVEQTPEDVNLDTPASQTRSASKSLRWLVVSFAAVALIAASAVGLYFWLATAKTAVAAAQPFHNFSIKRLTTDGRATGGALSPDGKLFAYSHLDGDKQSLWLGHVDGGDPIQLRAPDGPIYYSLRFSPDGDSIYYSIGEENGPRGIYRIPVFGGVPEKVADDSYSIAFAPDGKRFAYVRTDKQNKTVLLACDSNGKNETVIASAPVDSSFVASSVAWSPDGTTISIAYSRNGTENNFDVSLVNVSEGTIKPLTAENWSWIGSTAWLNDGSGLILNAQDNVSIHKQLWTVSLPGGEVRHLMPDLNLYGRVSMATGKNEMLVSQVQAQSNIWVAPSDDLTKAKQVTNGSIGRMDGWVGLAWMPDGRIVYTADSDGNNSIWMMNADGSEQKQIIPSFGNNIYPSIPADGASIVFQSNRGGKYAIWRANGDGSEPTQLTNNDIAAQPDVSPDGHWIVYVSNPEDPGELWKIPAAGGTPVKLADGANWPQISPDNRFIACGYKAGTTRLAIFSIDGGEPLKTFDLPPLANLRSANLWTPDGKAVTYRDWANGLWRQDISGGKPQRVKGLSNEKLNAYGWSTDGKTLAFTSGSAIRDVVLITDSN